MKKCAFLLLILFVCLQSQHAATRTWSGGATGNWFVAGNWLPSGTPGVNDTVVISTNTTITVDVNPVIAALNITGNSTVILAAAASRTISIGNGGTAARVFFVESGSTLTLGSGSGVSVQTYGSFVTNTATIDGTLILGQGASTWTVNTLPSSLTNTTINGTVRVASNNTGSVLLSGTTATLKFANGSVLDWQRNGGAAPNADFQNGSTINVTGISSAMMSFNSSAAYNGLLIWNCLSQTITGASALLLPATNSTMDSIRIVSTGASGTIRLATNPNGYTIGHLEVQGGVLELSAPASAIGSGSVTTDLKITNGVVRGNATYAFDNLSSYPMSLTVNGNFTMTGGSFDFTNRPTANAPAGAFILNVKGNVSAVSPSLIFATSGFGSQNQINMNGTALQSLEISSLNNAITLVINNAAGVDLQNNIILPYALNLFSGFLQLNGNDLTVDASLIFRTSGKVVTNGIGLLVLSNVNSVANFYMAPTSTSYNPLTITSSSGNTISARVAAGINDPSGSIPADAVQRTWYMKANANISASVAYVYADADCSAGALPQPKTMEILQSDFNVWHLVAGNTSLTPTGADPAWTVTTAVNQNLLTILIPYTLGVAGTRILATDCIVSCDARKNDSKGIIHFTINNCAGVTGFEIQRAVTGGQFVTIGRVQPDQQQRDYSFTDMNLPGGTSLYRIRVNRNNGGARYSNVAALIKDTKGLLITGVYPNPVTDKAIVAISSAIPANIFFEIVNVSGVVVKKQSSTVAGGSAQVAIPVNELASGLYFIRATYGDTRSVIRFFKQ